MTGRGALEGDAGVLRRLAAAGVESVADVLARSEAVRDLARRSNHVLRLGRETIHVKRSKTRGPSKEAASIRRAAAAGVPVATIAFEGRDPRLGSVVGTFDLAPARPFDDLLREGSLSVAAKTSVLSALADAVAALHRARLHHRDLYLNHVYVDPETRPPTIALIDLERLGRHRGALGMRVVKDLAAIESSIPDGTISDAQRADFLSRYLRGRGLSARSVAAPLAKRISKKAARIRRHVPRTPVGPAARPA